MKADATSFTFLGNAGVVKIPFFQRGYVWNQENWEDIWRELLDKTRNHFLGSIILKQQEVQTNKVREVLVIDGQQRLTTLSILLKALYDSFQEDTQKNCENAIRGYLFYKEQQTDSDYYVKIEHSRLDSPSYKKVIENKLSSDECQKIDKSYPLILQCYKYFLDSANSINIKDRIELFNRLLNPENKILVLIDLAEKDDEQTIFDTINSAGVRLSCADIIKNALFQQAIKLINKQADVIAMYKTNWEDIFAKDDDALTFWSTSRPTGRLMRDNIEILLHSIAVIKNFFDPDKHTLSDLSALYKKQIMGFNKNELIELITDIGNYGNLYRDKMLVFNKSTIFSYDDNAQRLFHILDECEISTFHPYILELYKKHAKSPQILDDELKKIEKFIMRQMITKGETKSYNKLCKEFLGNSASIDAKVSEISDSEVKGGLQSITNKNAALILFWVELYRRHLDSKQAIKELKYNYSLEHIMPQKWEQYWSIITVPVKDDHGSIIVDPIKASEERYKKVYCIGNMTLLNSSLNTSLRNYEFKKKVEGDGKKKGIKSYADLSITKEDIIVPFDSGNNVWDESNINDRTSKIAKEVLSLW